MNYGGDIAYCLISSKNVEWNKEGISFADGSFHLKMWFSIFCTVFFLKCQTDPFEDCAAFCFPLM